jgi:hypothetical protein
MKQRYEQLKALSVVDIKSLKFVQIIYSTQKISDQFLKRDEIDD